MSIGCPDGRQKPTCIAEHAHEEIGPGKILSVVASPNSMVKVYQSVTTCDNMYQCQMAKQTAGSMPLQLLFYRPDTKIYALHTRQRPVAMTGQYDRYQMDNYPLGTNAVVAVLAHTGYDMARRYDCE